MRTIRLYTDQSLLCGDHVKLENKTAHHLTKSLRAKTGDKIALFNGDGFDYTATLLNDDPGDTTLSVDEKIKVINESPVDITLLQGLSRGDRMEVALQKSVELGVNTIIPVMCTRSNYTIKPERKKKKTDHWNQIIISACEQSGRATIPQLMDILDYTQAVQLHNDYLKILLSTDATQKLNDINRPDRKLCILIGPEGGLTQEEVNLASNYAYNEVKLGSRTLRTETAGPAAISAIQTLWGDF